MPCHRDPSARSTKTLLSLECRTKTESWSSCVLLLLIASARAYRGRAIRTAFLVLGCGGQNCASGLGFGPFVDVAYQLALGFEVAPVVRGPFDLIRLNLVDRSTMTIILRQYYRNNNILPRPCYYRFSDRVPCLRYNNNDVISGSSASSPCPFPDNLIY